jgi:hypothetical protein
MDNGPKQARSGYNERLVPVPSRKARRMHEAFEARQLRKGRRKYAQQLRQAEWAERIGKK